MFDVLAFRPAEGIDAEEQAQLVLSAFRGHDAGALPSVPPVTIATILNLRLPALVPIAEDVPSELRVPAVRMAWVGELGDVGLLIAIAPWGVGIARPLEDEATPEAERAVERICEVLSRDAGMLVFDAAAEATWVESSGELLD